MKMKNFKAIAYHGSDDINLKEIEDIDFDYKKHKDHFLGRGFYLFRDSFKRAKNWTDEQHSGENKKVIEVELDINSEDILNFTSTHWGYELDFIESYLKVCRSKKIHLGSFSTPEEAFEAYKTAKEEYIKEVADKWRGQITEQVYHAMYNYKVEIID